MTSYGGERIGPPNQMMGGFIGVIEVNSKELDLERTLLGGQSFRWKMKLGHNSKHLIFTGVILDRVLQLWRVSADKIEFELLNGNAIIRKSPHLKLRQVVDNIRPMLEDYFHLNYKLADLYEEWSKKDEHVAKCCRLYKGFRILRQDPVENVFSFICATNNNIKRISIMVDKLCETYGDKLETDTREVYYSFPSIERLAREDVFECLRFKLGFGYRAKFINETAKEIIKVSRNEGFNTARDYLKSLRKLTYEETCQQLMRFQGIGRKVSDCICLMSMDHLNSVPVDCHIHEIVCRYYMPNLKSQHKTLTPRVHDLISDYFNKLHGPLAGWSTSIMFIAELKHLKQQSDEEKKPVAKKTKVVGKKPTGSKQ